MPLPSASSGASAPRLIAIAAMAENRVIGRSGTIPWHMPEDLKFFRRTTLGHPVLMGRKTWESLGRPLPGRRNLVLSRTLDPASAPGAEVLRSRKEFQALRDSGTEGQPRLTSPVYLIGGAEIYRLLLPVTDEILLTVLTGTPEGDTFFPEFGQEFVLAEILDEIPGRAQWRRYVRQPCS